jgi:glycosyltransferase involved in cell wall biosynthesis
MNADHSPRYLVVTPYYKEERFLLERCIASVKKQTIEVDHLLVSDGFPQDWLDFAGVRHIKLDRGHGDYGNTPRGIGAVLAIAEGYDGFCFCDADNWLEQNHIALCLIAARNAGEDCDFVISRRFLRRPDETIMSISDEPIESHVDTNCFFFLPGSYHSLHFFAGIPRELAGIGDRLFYLALKAAQLNVAVVDVPSVNYHCLWAPIYAAAKEEPPAGAKPHIDKQPMTDWLSSRTPRERQVISRMTGLTFL